LKQIGLGLEMFGENSKKFPLELSALEAGDAKAGNTIAVTKRADGKIAATGNPYKVPDITAGNADTAAETNGTHFQVQALLFARLYGQGANWSTSGGSGVVQDRRIFDCPVAGSKRTAMTYPTGMYNFDILGNNPGGNTYTIASTIGAGVPMYGANVKISYSSFPYAISAADAGRDVGSSTNGALDPISADQRKGLNHNLENFNYLYRDGHVDRKATFDSASGKNFLEDSSSPKSDLYANEALDTAARPEDTEMVTLF
jgi:hypothetical protein